MSDGGKIGIGLVAAYFGLFGLIVLDEIILGTDYLERFVPDGAIPVLQVIYYPLIPLYVWLQEFL